MSASAKAYPVSSPVRLIVNRKDNRQELETALTHFHATYDADLKHLHQAVKAILKRLNANGSSYPTLCNASEAIEGMIDHFSMPPEMLKDQALTGPLPKRAWLASADATIALANYLEGLMRNETTPEQVRHDAADAYIIITERLRDTDFQKDFEDLSMQLETFCREIIDNARPCYVANPSSKDAFRVHDVVQAARNRRMKPVYNQA